MLTQKILTVEDWENYKIKRKKDLSKIYEGADLETLENLILRNDTKKLIFCTCRRLGKTYKIMIKMLYDLFHLPWFNGLCLRKYQTQVEENLKEPMFEVIEILSSSGVIPKNEFYNVKKTRKEIIYDGRKIIFKSIEGSANSLGFQPSGGKYGYRPVCQTILIDEIIQDQDNYRISVDKTLNHIKTIRESINRGSKIGIYKTEKNEEGISKMICEEKPFGRNLQEYWTLNPWAFNNEIYKEEIESVIPVGAHYVSNEKVNEVIRNHEELLKGKGELIYEKEGETIVYRGSYKIIPKSRWNNEIQEEFEEYLEKDRDRWDCVFAGIHAPLDMSQFTYINNMSRQPIIYDEKTHGKLLNIEVGLDRGINDNTAFSLTSYSKDKNGKHYLIINDIEVFTKKEGTNSLMYLFKNLDFLKEWNMKFLKGKRKLRVITDYASYEFNNYFNDLIKTSELNKYIALYKSKKDSGNYWGIKQRQDFFNLLFSRGQILFSNEMSSEKVEMLWWRFLNCVNTDKGVRNEKPGVNKLDEINSLEYSISLINRLIFNV